MRAGAQAGEADVDYVWRGCCMADHMELRSLACRVLVLAFTLSLDDLVIASFVTGLSATTLPMAVFSSVRLGVSPEVNALRRCSSLSSSCWWRSPFG